MKSMTGFGSASARSDQYEVICECTSVNRKHLDIQVRVPSDLHALEPEVRSLVNTRCMRGHVTVTCIVKAISQNAETLNHDYISAVSSRYKALADCIGYDLDKKDLFSALIEEVQVWQRPVAQVAPFVHAALIAALDNLDCAKMREGLALENDFMARICTLQLLLKKVEGACEDHFAKCQQRALALLNRLVGEGFAEDPKLAQELAILVEKSDIAEEIVRARFHLDRLVQLVPDSKSSGKQIEFVLQELMREWNTMGSKVHDIQVTQLIIDAKCEIERLKEQVQNVE